MDEQHNSVSEIEDLGAVKEATEENQEHSLRITYRWSRYKASFGRMKEVIQESNATIWSKQQRKRI